MRRAAPVLGLLLLILTASQSVVAQTTKQIRVVLESQQTGIRSRDAAQGTGRVIITDRGRTRTSGGVALESTERTMTATTGIFTIVQDGGESVLNVSSQVPYSQVAYYRNYLTGAGYVTSGIVFRDVGTSLQIRASVLPGDQIRVRLTPRLSWFAGDRGGIAEVNAASIELIVPNGRPVVIGGATMQVNELTRTILGIDAMRSAHETQMTLTATILQ